MVHDHVTGKFVLGYKLLVCGFWDGESFIPIDFSLHREKGKKLIEAEQNEAKARERYDKTKTEINMLKEKLEMDIESVKQARIVYQGNATTTNKSIWDRKENTVYRTKKHLLKAEKKHTGNRKMLKRAKGELIKVQEGNCYYGLNKQDFTSQYKKSRQRNTPGSKRAKEADSTKIDNAVKMLKRAVKHGFIPDYVLTDTWFFCFTLLKTIIEIGRDIDLISMAKIGTAKYVLLRNGKSYYPAELIKLNERKVKYNREFKAHYIMLPASYQEIRINMFFVKIGCSSTWHLLVTTDLALNFKQLLETYKIRWSIEVFFKECKQYLLLEKCYSSDFNAQIADTTLCMIRYLLLSYYKRIHYNPKMPF